MTISYAEMVQIHSVYTHLFVLLFSLQQELKKKFHWCCENYCGQLFNSDATHDLIPTMYHAQFFKKRYFAQIEF